MPSPLQMTCVLVRSTPLRSRIHPSHVLRPTRGYASSSSSSRSYAVAGAATAGAMAALALLGVGYTGHVRLDSPAEADASKRRGGQPDSLTGLESRDMMFQLQTNDSPGDSAGRQAESYITMEEVARHNLSQDAWVVVDGKVYDVTDFHKFHPGGSGIIVGNAGRDVTELFRPVHPPGTLENNLAPENFKGVIDPKEAEAARLAFETEQQRLQKARNDLPPVETMLGIEELQEAAKTCMTPGAIDYYAAGALDSYSVVNNRESFRKCRLVPRVLRDVSAVRPQTKIFGVDSALPIYVSPSSNALLGHPDGELNITRGASATGIVQGISAVASYSLADILNEKDQMDEASGRKMGMVYQVYFQRDRSKTEAQVRQAVEGGVNALVLTVDSNVGDNRQSTEKLKGSRFSAEPGPRMGPITETPTFHDPSLNWDDIVWLQSLAQGLPIYLKGVCHIDDVRRARDMGLAGCILSNHGGRQLDQRVTRILMRIEKLTDPQLLKDFEVYIDGGIRRGSDVLKAVALGARGVGLGRPFLFAQAAYGDKGVIRAVRILENEIVSAMRLLGLTSIDQVDPTMIECLQEMWK
ncbi:Cytochrome b2, mitochondrial precursor [Saitozyma podzolica]|uniref:Cytochrome b2, mitochondrial n=1 Tax=Saitozyma podzolica TaxID=1890683 RepID=A0A427YG95_9TREE|nr:Cytochrome b2, mitochondrial precursor [Saitozyma podzolica]